MSKKKFKKKKEKKHSQQNVYVAPKTNVETAASEIDEEEVDEKNEEKDLDIGKKTVKPATDAIIPADEEKEYSYVRKDVKKILIVMGSIIVLLIIAFIVNSQTTIFHSMGNWLYSALNIQTQ